MQTTTSIEDAVEKCRRYNANGIKVSLSYLPVPAYTSEAVTETVNEYTALIQKIRTEHLDADITVKPQQFGCNLGDTVITDALGAVIEHAKNENVRVWLDKELATQVDIMHSIARTHGKDAVGICLQAFRERSLTDASILHDFPIRLVKGFYNDFDITPWSAVTARYSELMDVLMEHSSYPCFATHDRALIEKAAILLRARDMRGEIQFFAGVRDDLARSLVQQGFTVRIYLPYGRVYAFLWYGLPIFDRVRALKRLLGYEHIT